MVAKTAYARDVTDIDNERTEVKLGTGSQANLIRVCTGDMMGRPAWLDTHKARELLESLAEAIWLAEQFDPETDTYSGIRVCNGANDGTCPVHPGANMKVTDINGDS